MVIQLIHISCHYGPHWLILITKKPTIRPCKESVNPNQSYLHILSKIYFNMIQFQHNLLLGLASELFPKCFPIQILYAFLTSLTLTSCHKTSYFEHIFQHLTSFQPKSQVYLPTSYSCHKPDISPRFLVFM
jgi:hypothetical protein